MPLVPDRAQDSAPVAVHRRGPFPLWQVVLLAAIVALFARTKDLGLLGQDTMPILEGAGVGSPGDLVRVVTSPITEHLNFYRPVFLLTISLDRALWGLDPLGYQLSNLAAFVLCIVALGLAARRLLAGWVGTQVAVLAFLFFPAHAEVLAFPSRRPEILVSAFALLALWAQVSPNAWTRRRPPILPAVFALLAMGSKDNGLVIPAVCFVAVLAYAPDARVPERLRRAAIAMVPHALLLAGFVLVRQSVVRGLGGKGSPWEGLTHYPRALFAMVGELAVPELARPPSPVGAWLALLFAAALGVVLFLHARRSTEPEDAEGARVGRTALVGAAWLVLTTLVYAARGYLQPWYVPMLAVGWCLLAGAAAQLLADDARKGERRVRWPARCAALLMLLALAWQSRGSPILRTPADWTAASRSLAEFHATAAQRIEAAAPGSLVRLPPVPRSSTRAVKSWARMAFPDRELAFSGTARAPDPDEVLLVVRIEGDA